MSATFPPALPKTAPPTDRVLVLLVDDQPIIGEAIRRALAADPAIRFHYCAAPQDAVRVADQVKPTVILQDLVMPGVDGLSLVRQYRAHPPTQNIPVIVLSTKEDPAVKSEAFTVGANDYLVKIPDKVELIARVRYHSRAYVLQQQRDEAYRALSESQQLLVEANLELVRLTNVDGLTGLSNRRYFDEYLERQWKQAIRDQTPFSVLMIDVDDFKRYNDRYGHLGGDEVLKRVAGLIMKSTERPADLAARYGGEEFVVILPATPAEGAQAVAENIRRSIDELRIPHESASTCAHVTVSIGCASVVPRASEHFLLLLETADAALYEAKRGGRNRVAVKEARHTGKASGH